MSILKKHKNESIIIVGCGRFGSTLATNLSEQNKNVAIIDMNESAFRMLSTSYSGYSLEGDGTDIDLLTFAGAKNADIFIASTEDDNTNIMIAQIAKHVFKIKKVFSRITDTSKLITIKKLDIIPICPATLSVKEFERIIVTREKD